MKFSELILVRGGGDIATGIICRLHKAGFNVVVAESSQPTSIRRSVSLSEAVYEREYEVEGVGARFVETVDDCLAVLNKGTVPVMVDPELVRSIKLNPSIVVDSILAKKNLGLHKKLAPITIGVGPGFTAGKDVHAVIETQRGHDLGRVIYEGDAKSNTGVPAKVLGIGRERVVYATARGLFLSNVSIGSLVSADDVIGFIGKTPVATVIAGVVRGVIRDGFYVHKGLKIADIDPRVGERDNCFTISDKSRCVSGGVLEAILSLLKDRAIL